MFARTRGWLLIFAMAGLVSAGRGLAGPITNIAQTYLDGYRSYAPPYGGLFSWYYVYGLSFTDRTLTAQVNVDLIGYDPGTYLLSQWETGVESAWSYHYDIVDFPYVYPILLNLVWDTGTHAEVVTVHPGAPGFGQAVDMLNWYTVLPPGVPNSKQGVVAAHEIGHMLGLYDEYFGGALNPSGFTTTGALMADFGPVQERYYTDMLTWLEGASGRPTLTLAPHSGSVPEPASMTLIAIGILGVLARRRKFRRM